MNRPTRAWERSHRRVREVVLRRGVTGVGSCAFYESGTCVYNRKRALMNPDEANPTFPDEAVSGEGGGDGVNSEDASRPLAKEVSIPNRQKK